jgi:hypothetical protein
MSKAANTAKYPYLRLVPYITSKQKDQLAGSGGGLKCKLVKKCALSY